MKISTKQAKDLLKKLGVGVTEVVEDEKDADKDFKLEDVIAEVTEAIKDTVRPDIEDEVIKAKLPAETGKLLGTLRSAAQRMFGGTNKDYENLDIKQILELGKTKYDEGAGKAKTDWEKERDQLIAAHEAALTAAVTEKDTELGSWKTKYADRDINEQLIKITEKIPRIKGDITAHADMLRYKLSQKYDLKYNEEAKTLEFYTKDGKKARVNNKDVIADEAAKQEFTDMGILVTDMRGTKPGDVKNGTETNVKSGIDQIKVDHLPSNLQNLAAELQD